MCIACLGYRTGVNSVGFSVFPEVLIVKHLATDGGPYWTRTEPRPNGQGNRPKNDSTARLQAELARETLAVIARIFAGLNPAKQQALCLLARALERGLPR